MNKDQALNFIKLLNNILVYVPQINSDPLSQSAGLQYILDVANSQPVLPPAPVAESTPAPAPSE